MSTALAHLPLPPELLYHILRGLRGDAKALKALSLVCRDLAEWSRPHRFAEISLSYKTRDVCDKLVVLLEDMPYIRPHIRCLYVGVALPSSWCDREWIRAMLPTLGALHVHGGLMTRRSLEFIEAFDHLDTLCIQDDMSEAMRNLDIGRDPALLPLRRLSITHTPEICYWLLYNTRRHSLREITLVCGADTNINMAEARDALVYLLDANPQLEHLTLNLVRYIGTAYMRSSLQLCTVNVPHLTLSIAPSRHSIRDIARFLNTNTWPTLRTLNIRIVSPYNISKYMYYPSVSHIFRPGRDVNGLQLRLDTLFALERITVCFVNMGELTHAYRLFRIFGPVLDREGLIEVKLENTTLVN